MDILLALSGAKESQDDLLFALQVFQNFLADNSNGLYAVTIDESLFTSMMIRLSSKNAETWRMLKLLVA